MKFQCNTAEFSAACVNVMRAVSKKVTIPTIEGILVECGSGTLSLTGYDFEFGINKTMPCEVYESGAIIINAQTLTSILARLGTENVLIETNGVEVTVVSGETIYNITGIDADEYPELPSVTGGYPFSVDQKVLKEMINQTVFAVADNENAKPVHTGLKFELTENQLQLVGVDGYRLAIRKETIKFDGEDMEFIVPKKAIKELVKLMGDEGDILINVGKRHIIFEIENYSIISRLLDGDFLDYKAVVSKSSTTTVLINVNDAIDSIQKIVPIVENNQKNPIRCKFDNDEMRVSTISSIGKVRDYIHANISGNGVEIGFNSKYLLDAFGASDVDEVRIELNGPVNPAKILPVQGDRFLFLVLPMRLKSE